MDEFTIRYGGDDLSLRKSTHLIAVKSAVDRGEEAERAVQHYRGHFTGQKFNGFEVVDVDETALPLEEALEALRDDANISVGTHVYHTSDDDVPFVPTGELYIEFADDAPIRECQKLLDQMALELLQARGERQVLVRVTTKSPNPLKVSAALQASPHVAVAEPELATPARLSGFFLPSDPLLGQQWHLRNTGEVNSTTLGLKAGADARVVAAWERAQTLGNRDVIVGVIDDGFDLDHPDLSGPGKVVAPWDFTRNSSDPRPGEPFWNTEIQDWEGDWHGTACAGVAIGSAQGVGIVGAAPDCRLMPVRWGINLADAQIESWFDHVRTQGAWVVSCSWGAQARVFRLSTRASRAIARCAREGRQGLGCVVCFAAGNENRDVNHPDGTSINGFAIHPDVIAVAACTSRDQRSHYSNFGEKISVCAPSSGAGGWPIVTADVMGTFVRNGRTIDAGYSPGAYTSTFGGTSSSTPLVAGICALLLSIRPTLTATEVKDLLQQTARRIGPANSYNNDHSPQFGYGCVNAEAAVTQLLADDPQPASASRTQGVSTAARAASRRRTAKKSRT